MMVLYLNLNIHMIASLLFYLVEHGWNDKMNNYGDALWWGFITMTTIGTWLCDINHFLTSLGYGDIIPLTHYGRIITYFIVSCGYIMYAVPAGIIGTGFALKIREHSKIKHHQKRRQPAAYLIQNAWRYVLIRRSDYPVTCLVLKNLIY